MPPPPPPAPAAMAAHPALAAGVVAAYSLLVVAEAAAGAAVLEAAKAVGRGYYGLFCALFELAVAAGTAAGHVPFARFVRGLISSGEWEPQPLWRAALTGKLPDGAFFPRVARDPLRRRVDNFVRSLIRAARSESHTFGVAAEPLGGGVGGAGAADLECADGGHDGDAAQAHYGDAAQVHEEAPSPPAPAAAAKRWSPHFVFPPEKKKRASAPPTAATLAKKAAAATAAAADAVALEAAAAGAVPIAGAAAGGALRKMGNRASLYAACGQQLVLAAVRPTLEFAARGQDYFGYELSRLAGVGHMPAIIECSRRLADTRDVEVMLGLVKYGSGAAARLMAEAFETGRLAAAPSAIGLSSLLYRAAHEDGDVEASTTYAMRLFSGLAGGGAPEAERRKDAVALLRGRSDAGDARACLALYNSGAVETEDEADSLLYAASLAQPRAAMLLAERLVQRSEERAPAAAAPLRAEARRVLQCAADAALRRAKRDKNKDFDELLTRMFEIE
jgi:hypothetical protein